MGAGTVGECADPREHRGGLCTLGGFLSLGGTPALRRAPHISASRWDPQPSTPAGPGLGRTANPGQAVGSVFGSLPVPGGGSQAGSVPGWWRQIGRALLQWSGGGSLGGFAPPALPAPASPVRAPRSRPRSRCRPGSAPLAPWTHSRGATQEGREQSPVPSPPGERVAAAPTAR